MILILVGFRCCLFTLCAIVRGVALLISLSGFKGHEGGVGSERGRRVCRQVSYIMTMLSGSLYFFFILSNRLDVYCMKVLVRSR